MASHVLTCVLLMVTLASLIVCLPLGPYVSIPAQRWTVTPANPSYLPTAPTNPAPYWPTLSYYPVRTNHSNGQPSLPHFHSGPWDRAWEVWNHLSDKLKLFKRSSPTAAQVEIAQHLRPTGWLQRLKDWWRSITGRRLKITPAQVEEVRKKYRSRPPTYASQYRKEGRVGSAFPSRPAAGQVPAFRRKASSFST